MRLPVYSPTSSSVEQSFSRFRALGEQRRSIGEDGESVSLKLLVDRRPEEKEDVLLIAREVWREYYGMCRSSPAQKRIDTGLHKSSAGQKKGLTEVAFIRARRKSVGEMVATSAAPSSTAPVTAVAWTPAHQREADWQARKEQDLKLEAFHLLLPEEKDSELEEKHKAQEEAFIDNMAKRKKAARKLAEVGATLVGSGAKYHASATGSKFNCTRPQPRSHKRRLPQMYRLLGPTCAGFR